MAERISYYSLALYLALALAVTQLAAVFYLIGLSVDALQATLPVVGLQLAILFGIWVLSNAVRYLGGACLLIFAAGFIWSLFPASKVIAFVVWTIVIVITLALCWLLLLSKQFGREFSERRRTEPRYKRILRNVTLSIALVAAIIATANDIVHLMSF